MDYRFLNKVIECLKYPVPLIEDLIDNLRGKHIFTLHDLKDCFHHLTVSVKSIPYTAFITPLGHFEFWKMPFGLNPATVMTYYQPKRVQSLVDELILPPFEGHGMTSLTEHHILVTDTTPI